MAFSVTVVRSDGSGTGDNVYIDARYVQAASKIGQPMNVAAGKRTFETVDENDDPTWSATETISEDTTVTLQPVTTV
jgi:hypothetical protein